MLFQNQDLQGQIEEAYKRLAVLRIEEQMYEDAIMKLNIPCGKAMEEARNAAAMDFSLKLDQVRDEIKAKTGVLECFLKIYFKKDELKLFAQILNDDFAQKFLK